MNQRHDSDIPSADFSASCWAVSPREKVWFYLSVLKLMGKCGFSTLADCLIKPMCVSLIRFWLTIEHFAVC